MRIGILKTDSVRAEFQREFGDYPAMFRAMLMASADDIPIEFQDYDVQRGEYPASLDECDAYLITGSRESVYDDKPWIHRLAQFVRELDAAQHPLVGICFGHQLIAHVLGGETRQADVGWAVGVHETVVVSPRGMDAAVPRTLRLVVESQRSGRPAAGACGSVRVDAAVPEQRLHDR